MSIYGFYQNCLRTAQETYTRLLNTPRARVGDLPSEMIELKEKVRRSARYGEITNEQSISLLEELDKINFDNLPEQRKAKKESERCNARI